MHSLAEVSWLQWFLIMAIIAVCLFLMLVILLQRGRGGGLAGAFGGAGGSSAFGAKTGDVFTWVTVGVAVVFLLLTVAANFALDQSPDRRVPASDVASEEKPKSTTESTAPVDVQPVTVPVEGAAPIDTTPPAEEETEAPTEAPTESGEAASDEGETTEPGTVGGEESPSP